MTFQRGSDEPANPSGGPPAEPSLDLARLAADLEPRAARLERFVTGLASVLGRFVERSRGEDPAEIFADFEAPDASHEALRVLNEASTSARHDLAVLRRDIRPIVRANASGVEPAIVGRIREAGLASGALAARYESFATTAREWLATPAAAEHGPSLAAIEGLRGFISIADRALRDVAESAFIIEREDGHDEFGIVPGEAAAATSASGSMAAPGQRRDRRARRAGALLAAAAAGGAWSGGIARALRNRTTRIALELGAVGTVGAVILVSALVGGPPRGPADGDASTRPSAVASGP
ncbi:MAG: hypothetical protein L0221_03190, partial [Chloroflexi bacterium]|nr:hypothetical protein [Chloroflexota bacterium]